ncbi:Putative methyltransferase-like protein 7A [Linum grandiflorum]
MRMMIGRWDPPPLRTSTFAGQRSSIKSDSTNRKPRCSNSSDISPEGQSMNTIPNQVPFPPNFCPCCRRHFIGAIAISSLPMHPSLASDYKAVMNKVHPPRPDWYEELYARVLSSGMEAYEQEIADYKSLLFSNLKGKAKKVLEIGIGTGPNLKYYAGKNADIHVIGIDPNSKMQRYASEAAVAAGLPPSSFEFAQAVGEAIPLDDASVDAVIGTLVLCSVEDVDRTLQEVKRVLKPGGVYVFVEHVAASDGTTQRLLQNVLDPLQQTLADGCHLTRQTGTRISKAGFSFLYLDSAYLSSALFINPHVYGMATK